MAGNIKCIVVHISDDQKHTPRLRVAVELARRFDAHLNVIYAKPQVEYPAGAIGRAMSMHYLDEAAERERERAEEIRKEVAVVCGDLPSWEWHQQFGEVEKIVARFSHLADLVITEQSPHTSLDDVLISHMADHLVTAAGCPLLLLPWEGSPASIGTRVLIAWKNSKEASAALRASVSFLVTADEVFILAAEEDGMERPGSDVVRYLKYHGVHGKVIGSSQGEGKEIHETAHRHHCDLLVMGAYAHSRVRELLLGGATDWIMRHTTIPVLMRH
jgi:nucleotide-binding universal stress UspA family protein